MNAKCARTTCERATPFTSSSKNEKKRWQVNPSICKQRRALRRHLANADMPYNLCALMLSITDNLTQFYHSFLSEVFPARWALLKEKDRWESNELCTEKKYVRYSRVNAIKKHISNARSGFKKTIFVFLEVRFYIERAFQQKVKIWHLALAVLSFQYVYLNSLSKERFSSVRNKVLECFSEILICLWCKMSVSYLVRLWALSFHLRFSVSASHKVKFYQNRVRKNVVMFWAPKNGRDFYFKMFRYRHIFD